MNARAARAVVCLAIAASVTLAAQPLDRLSGRVSSAAGAPVADADVSVEALFGFAGGDLLGQRTFTARTNATGDWALLAFKAGIWIFDVTAPGQLPDALAPTARTPACSPPRAASASSCAIRPSRGRCSAAPWIEIRRRSAPRSGWDPPP
jgi:hypothetical protein